MEKVSAFAPATIANVNVGFDTLGIALGTPGDMVEVSFNGLSENRITQIVSPTPLPVKVSKNSCTVVIAHMQKALKTKRFVDVRIKKGFASGSGLGSSSASSAAAAYAFNALAGNPFSIEELIPFAAEGERIACKTAHLDNVAPALLGGIVLMHNGKPIKLPVPKEMYAVLFFPQIEVKTQQARSVIPPEIPLHQAIRQVSNMGAFIASLYRNDLSLMAESLTDAMIEPYRKSLIPFFDEMREAALQHGALAFGISGSGPSVFALACNAKASLCISDALSKVYKGKGIETLSFQQLLNEENGSRLCNLNENFI